MKVSVLVITYNHEPFLAQALDSALDQQVDFEYEIVVGEDCSTDGTRRILLDYSSRFPDKIKPLLPEHNIGMMRNFIQTFKACRGEYIAMLEGDDFWTSPRKLQTQVDLLDAHPECSASFHNVTIMGESGNPSGRPFHAKKLQPFFTQREIASEFFIPTCSTVFRNRLFSDFPDWFATLPMGDWPLHILNSDHGTYAYVDEVMGAYRVHGGGVWSQIKKAEQLQKTVSAMDIVNRHLALRHNKVIRRKMALLQYESAVAMLEEKDFPRAKTYLARALATAPDSFKLYRKIVKLVPKAFRVLLGNSP